MGRNGSKMHPERLENAMHDRKRRNARKRYFWKKRPIHKMDHFCDVHGVNANWTETRNCANQQMQPHPADRVVLNNSAFYRDSLQ
jgi:hypothetical protein